MTYSHGLLKDYLQNKKILIGITGSIACYKAIEVIRFFKKEGAKVRAILTDSAKKFISPLLIEALSGERVLEKEDWTSEFNHIGLSRWADVFLIAPATVNTINKMACGIADNLLLQTFMAFNKKVLVAPAANTNMYLNAATKKAIEKLKKRGVEFILPQSKELACGEVGIGALAEVEEIFFKTARELIKSSKFIDKKLLITAGGTIEKIDKVRFISNFSSGKMGYFLALAAFLLGFNVKLLLAKSSCIEPSFIEVERFENSKELFNLIKSNLDKNTTLFMAAAVSDFIPEFFDGKIKKEEKEEIHLKLRQNIDILKSLNGNLIGFKAEVEEESAIENAKSMLNKKGLQAVVLNILKKENYFGSNRNEVFIIKKGSIEKIELNHKLSVAFKILEKVW